MQVNLKTNDMLVGQGVKPIPPYEIKSLKATGLISFTGSRVFSNNLTTPMDLFPKDLDMICDATDDNNHKIFKNLFQQYTCIEDPAAEQCPEEYRLSHYGLLQVKDYIIVANFILVKKREEFIAWKQATEVVKTLLTQWQESGYDKAYRKFIGDKETRIKLFSFFREYITDVLTT